MLLSSSISRSGEKCQSRNDRVVWTYRLNEALNPGIGEQRNRKLA
jgi:hypothetical protein